MKHQRVAIFIDMPNLLHSAQQIHNAKIDLNCFLQHSGERQLIRAIVYLTKSSNGRKFQHVLEKLGFEHKFSPKTDCDTLLTVDALSMHQSIDCFIIGSGDIDYLPLCQALQRYGKRVEVLAVEQTASRDLIATADQFIPINSFLNK